MAVETIVILIFSSAWLLMFITGRAQYERIKKGTLELILTEAKKSAKRPGGIVVEQFYAQLQPAWEQLVKRYYFVLHKTELFPMLATPAYLRKRMNFTDAWLGAYLRVNKFACTAEPELDEKIKAIQALVHRPGKKA